jgi:hypothetical protein
MADIVFGALKCVELCKEIFNFVQSVRHVHKDIEVIRTEIELLGQNLDGVSSIFPPDFQTSSPELQTGHRGNLWHRLNRALEDCQGILRRLKNLLQKIQIPEDAFLSRPRTRQNLWLKSDDSADVAQLREKIRNCRGTIVISLQAISV